MVGHLYNTVALNTCLVIFGRPVPHTDIPTRSRSGRRSHSADAPYPYRGYVSYPRHTHGCFLLHLSFPDLDDARGPLIKLMGRLRLWKYSSWRAATPQGDVTFWFLQQVTLLNIPLAAEG